MTESSRGVLEQTGTLTRAATAVGVGLRRTTSVVRWLSPAAWAVLGVAVGALAAGYLLGWDEAVVIGWSLALLYLACWVFVIGRHPYAIGLRLSDDHVVVGTRSMGAVTVRNTGTRTALPARLEMPVGDAVATFALPGLAREAEHEELFAVPTDRRAVLTVGPVSSVRGDPFGLVRRSVVWTTPEQLYVHPRTARIGGASAGFLHDLEGLPSRELSNADLSFHALREYVPGDDRRYVHWRSSARQGSLMVRQFEESRRTHLVTGVSVSARDYADPDELELAISAAASLGLFTMRQEAELTALSQSGPLSTTSPRLFLDDLTRLDLAPGAGGVVDLARAVTRDAALATVVVLAFGSAVSAHDVRAMGAVLPSGVRVLALRCGGTGPTRVRRLGAVTALDLASLEDLPRGFRSMQR